MTKSTAPTQLRVDQQVNVETIRVTPELAETWLGRNEANRNLRPSNVARLVRDMQAGNFALTGDSIKFDWDGNLIDGQHRLTAVRDSGVAVYMLIVHGIAPTVRAVIDTGAKRSAADALRMAGKGVAGRSMAAAIRILLGISSGSIARAGDSAPAVTHSETVAFYDVNRELLDYCVAFANRTHRAIHARPSALAAAMFIAAQADVAKFTAFISDVAALNFVGTGSPARTLYKRMQGLRDERHEPSEEVYFLLRAFEAHLAGQPLTMMKSSTQNGRSILPAWPWNAAA